MARQATKEVQFTRRTRPDWRGGMTSGRAGVVLPISFIPVLRGDSCAGRFTAQFDLAEMPKPLQNHVYVNCQAWFVPKTAHPQFSGYDEFMHSFQGENIKSLGAADRTPPAFFTQFSAGADLTAYKGSTFLTTLGAHVENAETLGHNADLVDAYNLIWNFRAAAHSSRITRRSYVEEDATEALSLAPAFWPSGKFSQIVPDYERALILGSLDLDVSAGLVSIISESKITDTTPTPDRHSPAIDNNTAPPTDGSGNFLWDTSELWGELGGQTISTTLADIDKARTTQAFAKLRTAYAGNDATGFDNDDAIVAELMQGFRVPEDQFKRPWLLDSARVQLQLNERHATDAANLDDSVTKGTGAVQLSLNVPSQDVGGIIVVTCEVLPEQLHERQGDPFLYIDAVNELPDALRDVQRPEPVDLVPNWRIDARHTSPELLYGYEPMNCKWDRRFSVLGGKFYQDNPSVPTDDARAGVWTPNIVDPAFTADHYLAPQPFPHDVFSLTSGDAVEIVFSHDVQLSGITQKGDVLAENNDNYVAVEE